MGEEKPEITYEVEWSDEYECDVFKYTSDRSPVMPNGLPSIVGIDRVTGRLVFEAWLDENGFLHRDGAHAFEDFGEQSDKPYRKWYQHGQLIRTETPTALITFPDEIYQNEQLYLPKKLRVVYASDSDGPSPSVAVIRDPLMEP